MQKQWLCKHYINPEKQRNRGDDSCIAAHLELTLPSKRRGVMRILTSFTPIGNLQQQETIVYVSRNSNPGSS